MEEEKGKQKTTQRAETGRQEKKKAAEASNKMKDPRAGTIPIFYFLCFIILYYFIIDKRTNGGQQGIIFRYIPISCLYGRYLPIIHV